MTEPQRKKLPPETCPRCHGVKEPEEGLCGGCLHKEKEFIAERTTTDTPGVYETSLSKTEVVALSALLMAAMAGLMVWAVWKVIPKISEMMQAYTPPPVAELTGVIFPLAGALFADFILLMILLNFWKSYRKSLQKKPAETPAEKA